MVYVYPRYAPMAEFIQKSGVWFVRGLQEDTHQERDLLPRDGAVGSPFCVESQDYLPATGGNGCATDLDRRKARC